MIVRIYLIVEEGADRVYVQTSFPAWYVKPEGKRSEIYAVDVELPALRLADQYGERHRGCDYGCQRVGGVRALR